MSADISENFKKIARNFPYKTKLELCDEDAELLVDALAKQMETLSETNKTIYASYNKTAAKHLIAIDEQLGIEHAANYWFQISMSKFGIWGDDFFNVNGVEDIIKDIYMLDVEFVEEDNAEDKTEEEKVLAY